MIKHTQGFSFRYVVKSPNSQLIIKGTGIKYIISTIEEVDGVYYIYADRDTTMEWVAGNYKYQILNEDGVESEGDFIILRNFALADADEDIKTVNERYLEAIEAQIAGKATAAQSSMSVGDKSISYCSIDELMKLRDYFKSKVDNERGKFSSGNQGKIKYTWTGR